MTPLLSRFGLMEWHRSLFPAPGVRPPELKLRTMGTRAATPATNGGRSQADFHPELRQVQLLPVALLHPGLQRSPDLPVQFHGAGQDAGVSEDQHQAGRQGQHVSRVAVALR